MQSVIIKTKTIIMELSIQCFQFNPKNTLRILKFSWLVISINKINKINSKMESDLTINKLRRNILLLVRIARQKHLEWKQFHLWVKLLKLYLKTIIRPSKNWQVKVTKVLWIHSYRLVGMDLHFHKQEERL